MMTSRNSCSYKYIADSGFRSIWQKTTVALPLKTAGLLTFISSFLSAGVAQDRTGEQKISSGQSSESFRPYQSAHNK